MLGTDSNVLTVLDDDDDDDDDNDETKILRSIVCLSRISCLRMLLLAYFTSLALLFDRLTFI